MPEIRPCSLLIPCSYPATCSYSVHTLQPVHTLFIPCNLLIPCSYPPPLIIAALCPDFLHHTFHLSDPLLLNFVSKFKQNYLFRCASISRRVPHISLLHSFSNFLIFPFSFVCQSLILIKCLLTLANCLQTLIKWLSTFIKCHKTLIKCLRHFSNLSFSASSS